MERVLAFAEALETVMHAARSLPRPAAAERLPLLQAAGRVLAEPVRAERDQPPFTRSTRDGFAVQSADLQTPRPLRLRGSVRAGERWAGAALHAGEAVEIMTGAPLPDGADAVLMLEHASAAEDGLLLPDPERRLRAGENVVARGAEAQAGAEVLPAGRRVGAAEIAVAAACGQAELAVYARPRVAIVATGDELVELGEVPQPWQIRNSNSYALAALVAATGGVADRLPVAPDTPDALRDRVAEGRNAGLLLFSGGVSAGKYDFVEAALAEAGAEFFFTGALIQPGKPVVFGRLPGDDPDSRDTYFFGLPGNPVSTEVCFRLFVAPLLLALGGEADSAPRFAEARLAEDVAGGTRVTRFLPAEVRDAWDSVSVRTVPWQGSGDLAANSRANGFVVLPAGVEQWAAGDGVRVLLR